MLNVKLHEVIDSFKLTVLNATDDLYRDIEITSDYVHRFGLELISPDYEIGPGKIIVAGMAEKLFLDKLNPSEKKNIITEIFSKKFVALIVTNSMVPEKLIMQVASKYHIPIFSVEGKTSPFISDLTNFLEERLEPTITRPAGFMSIHGEGVLITGESGIGKSEVALELIHRGHKFVSDDLTEIRRNSTKSLVGFSPGNISKFIEVRGIGIINVQQLFGVNAIKATETIDLVVNFELWKDEKVYDRLGIEEKYVEILGIKVPYISIPVKSGKNLAVIVEVAAMNNRLKKSGLNPYHELMSKIAGFQEFMPKESKKVVFTWDK